MLDITLEEKLLEKVGGKFKLTKLIQQRLVELNRGARPLIEVEHPEQFFRGPPRKKDLLRVIISEILEEKICLAPRSEIQLSIEEEAQRMKEAKGGEEATFGDDYKKIKEARVKEYANFGFMPAKE